MSDKTFCRIVGCVLLLTGAYLAYPRGETPEWFLASGLICFWFSGFLFGKADR